MKTERNARGVSRQWMESAFLHKLWLVNCTVKEMWKDRGEKKLVIKEAGTD
jgi:hypothetical protein